MRFFCLTLSFAVFCLMSQEVEEIIVTGAINDEVDKEIFSAKVIDKDFFDKINIVTVSELSKYLSSSSGSRFQTNNLDGVDQGMSNINLRGLDNSSTLLLINSKRQTTAGTPSTRGQGYVDVNIIPEIAIKRIEILKESASPQYGSDAVAGVVNIFTYEEFDGFRLKTDYQSTENYDQSNTKIGMLFGKAYENGNYVVAFDFLKRKPLSASEIEGIAELAVSGLGRSFKVSEADVVSSGLWAGEYKKNQKIPDPDCINNGGVLTNPTTCGFQYGNRFNIVNDEDHNKIYTALNHEFDKFLYSFKLLLSDVNINDNPQSPSYPALPFLARKINPNQGMSPFNVPVTWYGRPLGSEFESPYSPKKIDQYHFNQILKFDIGDDRLEISLSQSGHKNDHFRPDIIDSRFLLAINGNGGKNGNETWNLFDYRENSQELIDFVKGAEVSSKKSKLLSLELLYKKTISDSINLVIGASENKEDLNINYDEISRAEFTDTGALIKTADLFFLGGGKNVSSSRNNSAIFFEILSELDNELTISSSARYEKYKNDESFDPKFSLKYRINNNLAIRTSASSSFVMPSMAQMFSSEINLGSVRDLDDSSSFVRQARIGNEELKAATAESFNIGMTYSINSLKLLFDYWQINFEDRIEIESSQVLINEDPFNPAITRNENNELIGVTTTYFNEESTDINGFDFSIEYSNYFEQFGQINYVIDLSILDEFLTPNFSKTQLINRVGKFNYDNHTFSLPKRRINTFLTWKLAKFDLNINTRYIDSYVNERSIKASAVALGYTNKINSSLMTDISIEKNLKLHEGKLRINFSIANVFDKSAPKLYDAPDFSFDTRVHDPRGRIFGIGLEYNY